MAVDFLKASVEALNLGTAPVTAVPLTMACWFNVKDITTNYFIFSLGDQSTGNNYFVILAAGGVGGDPIAAQSSDSGGAPFAVSSSGFSADTWHHACGVYASATSRSAFLDGGNKGSEATENTPTGIDRLRIGSTADSSPVGWVDGAMAETAVWNVALTDAEVAILGLGYSPLMVRPSGLVFYSPLIRDISAGAWPDLIGGVALTEVNTPTVAVHPPIFYPSAPMLIPAGAAAAGITAGEIMAATSPHYDLGAFGPATMVPY